MKALVNKLKYLAIIIWLAIILAWSWQVLTTREIVTLPANNNYELPVININ